MRMWQMRLFAKRRSSRRLVYILIYNTWDVAWEKHRETINCLIRAFLGKLLTNIHQLFLPSMQSLVMNM